MWVLHHSWGVMVVLLLLMVVEMKPVVKHQRFSVFAATAGGGREEEHGVGRVRAGHPRVQPPSRPRDRDGGAAGGSTTYIYVPVYTILYYCLFIYVCPTS